MELWTSTAFVNFSPKVTEKQQNGWEKWVCWLLLYMSIDTVRIYCSQFTTKYYSLAHFQIPLIYIPSNYYSPDWLHLNLSRIYLRMILKEYIASFTKHRQIMSKLAYLLQCHEQWPFLCTWKLTNKPVSENLKSHLAVIGLKKEKGKWINLFRSRPGTSGAIRAIKLIRYMWSATDSGSLTSLLTHPALFVFYFITKSHSIQTSLRETD